MTAQIQKQKYKHVFEWAEKQFAEMVELFTKKKSWIILETARRLENDGCEPSHISNEIVTNLSGFIDDSYVRKVLKDYPQYKDQKHVESAKSRRNIPAKPESPTIELGDKVKVEDANNHASEPIEKEEPITAESTKKIAENVLILSPSQQQPKNSTIEQPGPKEVQGPHNIAPEEYELEHLQEYDKDLLIDIIKYLDKRPLGHDALYDRIDVLKREIAEVKRENAQLREQLGDEESKSTTTNNTTNASE